MFAFDASLINSCEFSNIGKRAHKRVTNISEFVSATFKGNHSSGLPEDNVFFVSNSISTKNIVWLVFGYFLIGCDGKFETQNEKT